MENFYDNKIKDLYKKIDKRSLFAFIFTFISCFFCNLFIYTNTLFVHDSTTIYNDSTGITNGRFLVSLLMPLLQRFSLPILIGFLTSLFIAFALVFIIKAFDIKSKLLIAILSLFIISHQSFVACHYYFSSAYIYAFCILMSVLSFYFVSKNTNNRKQGIINTVISTACLITSLSGYQAYISLYLSLCIIQLIVKIINNEYKTIKHIFLTGIKYVGVAVISMGLYYCLWKAILLITDSQVLSDYGNYSNMEETVFGNFYENSIAAFVIGIRMLFGNWFHFSNFINVFVICCNAFAILLSFLIKKKKNAKHGIILSLLCLLLPLSVCFIFILSPNIFHSIMLFATIVPFILLIKNLDTLCKIQFKTEKIKNTLLIVLAGSLVIISLWQIVSANIIYLKMKVNYNNSISYCTRLLDRIEQTDGFNENTKVVFVSDNHYINKYPPNEFWTEYTNEIPLSQSGLTYDETFIWFIKQNLNTNIDISTENKKYSDKEEVINLDIFPAKNCMLWDGDTLVVKIGLTATEIIETQEEQATK